LNAHCGITPEYAGSSAFDRALYEGRFDAIGYTVHLVVPTVDGGPVLHQERIAWDPRRPNRELWPLLAQGMYAKLADVVLELASGRRLVATPQRGVRVHPPAGLFVRLIAELRRMRYARREGR
jgi:folate-dependent phosphoribosylglycinamide formyltransferase PurN